MGDNCDDTPFIGGGYAPGDVRLYGSHVTGIKAPIREEGSPDPSVADADNLQGADDRAPTQADIDYVVDMANALFGLQQQSQQLQGKKGNRPAGPHGRIKSVAVIYGYSYEGHCYRLQKPLVMLLPVRARPALPGPEWDCGFSPNLGYRVWVVDKMKDCIVLDIRKDDIKTIILEENLPGKRSPQTYAQSMSLAPSRNTRDYGA